MGGQIQADRADQRRGFGGGAGSDAVLHGGEQEGNQRERRTSQNAEGDGVNILEVEGNWGRTIQGWINLQYVEYEDSQSVG